MIMLLKLIINNVGFFYRHICFDSIKYFVLHKWYEKTYTNKVWLIDWKQSDIFVSSVLIVAAYNKSDNMTNCIAEFICLVFLSVFFSYFLVFV